MDNAPWMTIINSIDELKEKEFDLVVSDSIFVLGHIFFHVVVQEVKDKM